MKNLLLIKKVRVTIWSIVWLCILAISLELLMSNGAVWQFSNLEKHVLRKENDHWTHSAFDIDKIKHRSQHGIDKQFVFVGGSASLEAISDDRIISENLSRIYGKKIDFKSICGSYQSFSDNAKIVKALGNFRGAILIGIEPASFKLWPERQLVQKLKTGHLHKKYYFLNCPQGIRDILEKYGMKVELYHQVNLLRTAQVYGEIINKKYKKFIMLGGGWEPIVRDRHAVGDKKPVRQKKNRCGINSFCQRLLCWYNSNHRLNVDLLNETIRIARSNGNEVILLDLPTAPPYRKMVSKFNPHYNNMISRLVHEQGIGYIDMRKAADWDNKDFRDFHHLRSPGQKKFTDALTVYLSQLLS